jgi:hypothetical protein
VKREPVPDARRRPFFPAFGRKGGERVKEERVKEEPVVEERRESDVGGP